MKKTINTMMSGMLLAFCLVCTAQAQVVARAEIPSDARVEAPSPERTAATPVDVLSTRETVSEAWFNEVEQGYAATLKDTEAPGRVKTMQEIIFIARHFSDKVQFTEVISPLLNIYIFDKNEGHRLMALSALHTIGDGYGMQRLRELAKDEPSERVRRLTHRALADYYGPKKNR